MGSTEFTQLTGWQKAHGVRCEVFRVSDSFPPAQSYRLTAQMQTAALSVPANIAEGFGRRHPKDKAKVYRIAKGSADEPKDYLIFARDRGYWPDIRAVWNNLAEVCRMLRRLIEVTLGGSSLARPLGFSSLYSLFSSLEQSSLLVVDRLCSEVLRRLLGCFPSP
jgi:four helix bundle protein